MNENPTAKNALAVYQGVIHGAKKHDKVLEAAEIMQEFEEGISVPSPGSPEAVERGCVCVPYTLIGITGIVSSHVCLVDNCPLHGEWKEAGNE